MKFIFTLSGHLSQLLIIIDSEASTRPIQNYYTQRCVNRIIRESTQEEYLPQNEI